MFKAVEKDLIKTHNKKIESDLNFDYEYLEKKLRKENIDINDITPIEALLILKDLKNEFDI